MHAEIPPGQQVIAAANNRRHESRAAVQVFARDTRLDADAPLVYLAPGQADQLRPDARAGHLVCPLADCQDSTFVVRGGLVRRHHFAHRAGAGHHTAETIAHHTAKHLVARWLREQYPTATVYPDTKEVETGQRPDVLLELPDGTQVAYEVQFADLTAGAWQARRDRYASEGIKNVWLFGGRRYDRAPAPGVSGGDWVSLHGVFRSVLAELHPMLLIDPFAQTVALGAGDDVFELLVATDRRGWGARMSAQVGPRRLLQDLPATRGVLEVPGVRPLLEAARAERVRRTEEERLQAEHAEKTRADAEKRRAEEQERERLERERAERLDAQRRLGRERAEEAARAEQALQLARATQEADRRRALWAAERSRVEATIGPLPVAVDAPVAPAELAVTTAAPDEWRWRVLSALQANWGFTVNPQGLRTLIPRRDGIPTSQVDPLLGDFLVLLRAHGWVWFWGARRPRSGEAVRVLAGVGAHPQRPRSAQLKPLPSGRVSGPGPGNHPYLDVDGTPSVDPVDRSRAVGTDAASKAMESALEEEQQRMIRTALAEALPPEEAGADASGAPNLIGVYRALPEAARWCVSRDWPVWRLPPRLHETARLTFYVLAFVYRDQPQADVRLADCSPEDALSVLEELHRQGFVSHGALGWQATYGGVL
ncbi:competence protein CoiA family protein [Cellulomonas sp. T2.31MG-18]|uniref:competence protein CoiA family protein n=1 Tax=Cellulomonas sp. T2.31MG-18 TaxID=3157619 RepID=UPI00366C9DF7